jgi:hypothetical protein
MIPYCGLTFAGIVLLIWQPKWAKPPWLRCYQEEAREEPE